MSRWLASSILFLLLPALLTCGGSAGGAGDGGYGTFPVPGGPDVPAGTPPGSGAPPLPGGLEGGVLATFDVRGERFAMWVPTSPSAQILVDAWTGTGPAVSAVCADVEPGAGLANHNLPWSWSVRTAGSILLNGLCVNCAFGWNTPSKTEVGVTSGPPYNCDDTHSGGTRAVIMMQVTLVDLLDAR